MDNRRAVTAQRVATKQVNVAAKNAARASNAKAAADARAATVAYRRSTSGRTLGAERQRANVSNRTANQQFSRDSRGARQMHNQEQNANFRANNQYKQRMKTERGNGLKVFSKLTGFGRDIYGDYNKANAKSSAPEGYYLASDGNYYPLQPMESQWEEDEN